MQANHFEQEEAAFREQLARLCGFTDFDLAENRTGKLTAHQKSRLLPTALVPFSKLVLSLVGMVVFAVMVPRVAPPAHLSTLMVVGAAGLSALFFGLLAFVIKFLLATGRGWNLLRDLSEGTVTSVTGRLTTSHSEGVAEINAAFSAALRFSSERGPIVLRDYPTNEGKPTPTQSYCFVVKGEYFAVSQDAFHAMRDRDGGPYRVYVTPRSRYLLSLESTIGDPEAPSPFQLRSAQI